MIRCLVTVWWRIARLGLLLGLLGAGTAQAAHTCTYQPSNPYGSGPGNVEIPLRMTSLTIGRDLPDGSILYSQTVNIQDFLWTCTNDGSTNPLQIGFNSWLSSTPQPLASAWTGIYAGRVYQTGVPGIGVALRRVPSDPGSLFPLYVDVSVPPCNTPYQTCQGGMAALGGPTVAVVDLIKIGPVSPGVVSGGNLPSFAVDFVVGGVGGNALPMVRGTFSGTVTIVSQTCTTPDVQVDMGSHQTSVFTGSGSATPWKYFEVQLLNCPAFYGRYFAGISADIGGGGRYWSFSPTGSESNQISFTLTPTTPVLDLSNGIAALTPTQSGVAAASGVGLQVWWVDSDVPVTFGSPTAVATVPQLAATSSGNYSIPLRARYIQTGTAAPTPGPANATMAFTISYQ
ncbi:MAG: type 1 fimbrial protein [Betaproteobacteria bacterium]|nr:type 1 fimbrial protein [Betaproteobacteria bacterium]